MYATRTLGSRLYSAQKTVKGLTSVIINYFLKLFAYCISTKQGEPEKIKHGLNSLVCHAFGEHCKCDVSWCGALKIRPTISLKICQKGSRCQMKTFELQ